MLALFIKQPRSGADRPEPGKAGRPAQRAQADSAPRWWEKARAERYISAEYTLRQEFARKQVPRRAALPANSGNILADCEKFTMFRQNFATFRRI